MIDKWKKTLPQTDCSEPEEWIMSTITARGKNRSKNEELSLIKTADGILSLKELINSNLTLYLGDTPIVFV